MSQYQHTQHTDNLILRAYRITDQAKRRDLLKQAARMIGSEKLYVARQRAIWLGAIAPNQITNKRWTAVEDEILEKNAHLTPRTIRDKLTQAGYRRTDNAITQRIRQLQVGLMQARIDAGIYSADGAAKIIGVTAHSIIRWIETGILKGKRSGVAAGQYERWEIKAKDLKAFLKEFPTVIKGDRADMLYLVQLLTSR